jgi:ATP-dependent Lon protease
MIISELKNLNTVKLKDNDQVGVVTGLAWTEVGGELLSIETVVMPGKGKLEYTGKLGDVMKESIRAAKSYIRSKCLDYGIIPPVLKKKIFTFMFLKAQHQKMDLQQVLLWLHQSYLP